MAFLVYTRRTAHLSSQIALPSLIAGKENALQLSVAIFDHLWGRDNDFLKFGKAANILLTLQK